MDAFWDAIEHGGPGWPGEAKLIFVRSSELARFPVGDGASLLDALHRLARDVTNTPIELS
ncbi:hypothetical protein G4G27_04785 [Sphingomonas sp. So64.6b]|nr:hypothetical protein G4G27_04785 [Sphingomonas sp. So64.6b]